MSVESKHTTTAQPVFTLAQFAAITRWGGRRPFGLRTRIVTHYPNFPETVEVYRRHPWAVLYLLNRASRRMVRLSRVSGGTWKVRSVQEALAIVLKQEEQGATALPCQAWALSAHNDTARRTVSGPAGSTVSSCAATFLSKSHEGAPAIQPTGEGLEPHHWRERNSYKRRLAKGHPLTPI